MYKEINEFDRMIIGVREWAVENASRSIRDEVAGKLGVEGELGVEGGPITFMGMAKAFEEFVLRGIERDRGFMPDKAHLQDWGNKS